MFKRAIAITVLVVLSLLMLQTAALADGNLPGPPRPTGLGEVIPCDRQ